MKIRVLIILLILFLRLLPGSIRIFRLKDNQWLKVTGEVVKIEQRETDCTAKVGMYLISFVEKCRFETGDMMVAIGKVKAPVLNKLIGDINVQSSSFYIVSQNREKGKKDKEANKFWGDVWREKMVAVVGRYMPEPESGLVSGVVLGEKRGITSDWYQKMIRSGTVHVVVASGYNVMLVGGIILGLSFVSFKRSLASLIAIGGMGVYGMVTGGEPPVIRAVIMGSLIVVAQAIGRRSVWWWSLLLAGGVMVIIDPRILVSVSFQLTMAACVGIMGLEPVLQKLLRVWGGKFKTVDILSRTELSSTLSAQALTLPLIWWHFGRVSLVGLVSNLVILPLVPIVMLMGGLTILFGLAFPLITPVIAGLTYVPSFLIMRLVWFMGG